MPARDWVLRVDDILGAIAKIESYTAGLTSATFEHDERTQDAVVWNIAVIGEAARLIPTDVESKYPDVPWARMRGMRNIIVHEYFGIDSDIVWETATRNLLPLADALQRILTAESAD